MSMYYDEWGWDDDMSPPSPPNIGEYGARPFEVTVLFEDGTEEVVVAWAYGPGAAKGEVARTLRGPNIKGHKITLVRSDPSHWTDHTITANSR